MSDQTAAEQSAAPEAERESLRELRKGLLRLHKILLDAERERYEQGHGTVTSGEMLQLVINHEQFAWLHSISELIVRIDEMLEMNDRRMTSAEASALVAETRALLKPAEEGDAFGRKYHAALQSDPDVVLAHRDVTRLLKSSDGDKSDES